MRYVYLILQNFYRISQVFLILQSINRIYWDMLQHNLFIISATTLILTSIFCVILLWLMRGKSRPKLMLALTATSLLVFMIVMIFVYYLQPDFKPQILDFYYSLACIILVGLIFIYFRTLMMPWVNNRKLIHRLLYVLLTYIFLYTVFSIFFIPLPEIYTIGDIFKNIGHPTILLRIAAFLNFVTLFAIACINLFLMYFRHKTNIAELFSFREDISLSWLPYLIAFYILYGIWTVFDMFISEIGWIFIASNFIYSGFYIAITFLGVRQQDIYTKVESEYNREEEMEEKASPTNGMSPGIHQKLNRELTALMEQNHEYRNPDLRLDSVARMLNTNRTYLSTIIKEDFEDNFIGFVNSYRIKEAQELLSNSVSLSIIEISEQIGFKSISSFNTFFKKKTGVSPTQYRKIGE